jgi:hypothetical protein
MVQELPVVLQWRGRGTGWWRDLLASGPAVEKSTVRRQDNMEIMFVFTRFLCFLLTQTHFLFEVTLILKSKLKFLKHSKAIFSTCIQCRVFSGLTVSK